MSTMRLLAKVAPITLILTVFFLGATVNAQTTFIWEGTNGNAWSDGSNWNPATTPGPNDNVVFDGSAITSIVDVPSANATVNSISVSSNYTFNMAGNISTNDLDISGGSVVILQSDIGLLEVGGALTLGSNCELKGGTGSSVYLQLKSLATVGMSDLTAKIGEKIVTLVGNKNFMVSPVVFLDDLDITGTDIILGEYNLYLGIGSEIIGHTNSITATSGFLKTQTGTCNKNAGRVCKQYTGLDDAWKFPVGQEGSRYTPITLKLSCLSAPLTSASPFPHVAVRVVEQWGANKGHPDQGQPNFDFAVYWVVTGSGLPFSTGPQFGFSGLMEFHNNYRSGKGDSLFSAMYKDIWESSCLNIGYWDLAGSVQTGDVTGDYRSVPFGQGWDPNVTDCMYGYGDISCASNLGGTIPVELTSFSARYFDGSVRLNWQTATEINNHGFYIERSLDGEGWEEIAFIEGAGTSNVPLSYKYNDLLERGLQEVPQIAYRLRQEDRDGTIDYSGIVYAYTGAQPDRVELYKAYPNPFNPSTTLSFSLQEASHVSLKVFNSYGQEVATVSNRNFDAGFHTMEFDGANLPSGVYIAVLDAAGVLQQQKLVLSK